MMKKTLFVALLGLMTIANAMAADTDPVNMTITLKNGNIVQYSASDMDSVRFVGGRFGESGAIGMKIYLTDQSESIDYLYSQITKVTYTEPATTTTFTRITSADQLETGKRYIIVCENKSGAMGGTYENNYRALVTSGITLNDGTAIVEDDSGVSYFTLGGSEGRYTFKEGNDYLANSSSSTYLVMITSVNSTAQWSVSFENNNVVIMNNQSPRYNIYYYQDGGYFRAFSTGVAVQLYKEGTGGSSTDNNVNANWNIAGMSIPQSKADPTFTNQSTDDYAWRLEYPHINTASGNQRVVKAVST